MLIETNRLLIRPLKATDWKDVFVFCSDPMVMQYIPLGVLNKKQIKKIVSDKLSDKTECFGIELKAEKKIVGLIIYHPWGRELTYEIGWIISPYYQNKGLATEASKAVVQYGFLEQKLHRIIATCQPENLSSWKVAEKIGMQREGFFRKSIYMEHDKWLDEYFYAILINDWISMI